MHDRPSSLALEVFTPRSEDRGLAVAVLGAVARVLASAVTLLPWPFGRRPASLGARPSPPIVGGAGWGDLREIEADLAGSMPEPGALLADDGLDPATRARLASHWRERGCEAHASVAWFAARTRDLVALGAPRDLVAAANRDAEGALCQAELCFGLARAIDGLDARPSAFDAETRRGSLADLAVDMLVTGALRAGASARIAAKVARRATDPVVRASLERIAEHQEAHRAHAWDVVAYCVEQGGERVASALGSATSSLPKLRASLPAEAREGGWERWGVAGAALERQEIERTRSSVTARVYGKTQ